MWTRASLRGTQTQEPPAFNWKFLLQSLRIRNSYLHTISKYSKAPRAKRDARHLPEQAPPWQRACSSYSGMRYMQKVRISKALGRNR